MSPLHTMPMVMGILDPLYIAFGWIMRLLYHVFVNYGVVIIVFTVILRAAMIPLYVKQHKNSLMQNQLNEPLAELKRRYGDDRQGYSMAQMELYKAHKISMFSGCLPSLLGLIFIWPVWRIISSPLRYIQGVSLDHLNQLAQQLGEKGLLPARDVAQVAHSDIPVLQILQSSGEQLSQAVQNGLIHMGQLMNLDFLGLNLGLRPTWNPAQLFGAEKASYLPLLLIPIIAIATTFVSQVVMDRTNPMLAEQREARKRAAENPARDVPQGPSGESMMKSMRIMMPLMTLFTVTIAPAAMGLYWITGNLMAILQSWLLYVLYTKPVKEQIKRNEEKAASALKRKGQAQLEGGEK